MSCKPSLLPQVAVVLCTHNGAEWVEQQLQSLLLQTYPVAIRVFDDASSDSTVEKVLALGRGHDLQCTERTVALGFVDNFANGIQSVLDEGFKYIALADQDDVWLPERIERGMGILLAAEVRTQAPTSRLPPNNDSGAHLVHSNLTMVDAHNVVLHPSFMDWRGYQVSETRSLLTILGQNGVMGNTILMNANLARLALPFPSELHVHDYWLALIAELLGERHYLSECLVRYRIHDKNVSNSSRKVSLGGGKWSNNWSLRRFFAFDLRLPFKEDTRINAVSTLLSDPRFDAITSEEKETIGAFLRYLDFSENRIKLLKTVLKYNFFRPNVYHRMRVMINILITRRY